MLLARAANGVFPGESGDQTSAVKACGTDGNEKLCSLHSLLFNRLFFGAFGILSWANPAAKIKQKPGKQRSCPLNTLRDTKS
jgi:hypothetical protein